MLDPAAAAAQAKQMFGKVCAWGGPRACVGAGGSCSPVCSCKWVAPPKASPVRSRPKTTKHSHARCPPQDELAAILRFGAEDLFKTGGGLGGAGPDDEPLPPDAHSKALYEEDIDAILARAEASGHRGLCVCVCAWRAGVRRPRVN